MARILPALLSLVSGLVIGWLLRGSSVNSNVPNSEKPGTRKSQRSTPLSQRSSSSLVPQSLGKTLSEIKDSERKQMLLQIDGSNWASYLEEALSDSGRSRNLLTEPNIENLEFLHRIGEIAREEGVRILISKELEFAAAEVMEGWANTDPRGAFTWAKDQAGQGKIHENGKVFAKAAGKMIDVDFDEVWKTVRMIQGPLAKEFIRRKGVDEMDQLLLRYWTSPEDNRLPRSDFRALDQVYRDWVAQTKSIHNQRIIRREGEDEFAAHRRTWLEINNKLLSQPLNPQIRSYLERRNDELSNPQPDH